MKRFSELIGVVSGLYTLIDGIANKVKGMSFFTPLSTGALIICCISILIWIVWHYNKVRYEIYKYLSYWFRQPNLPYTVKEKSILYTYESLEEMKYEKKVTIVSRVDGLQTYHGKFRWSKPQSLNEFHVKCVSPHNSLTLARNTTWNTYTVDFEAAPKGGMREIDIVIDNLMDPKHEAVPYCSATIVERTEELDLTVILKDDLDFDVDSIRLFVYNNAGSTFPILEETFSSNSENWDLDAKGENKKLTFREKFPILGYKYLVSWNFRE